MAGEEAKKIVKEDKLDTKLTNVPSMKEVILFSAVRPEEKKKPNK